MGNKSDKPFAFKVSAICTVIILLFHFLWLKHFLFNLHSLLFTLIYAGLVTLFVIESIGAYRYADDPGKEWKRGMVIAACVALCLWLGGWAAYINNDKMFKQDVEKAKATAIIEAADTPTISLAGGWVGKIKRNNEPGFIAVGSGPTMKIEKLIGYAGQVIEIKTAHNSIKKYTDAEKETVKHYLLGTKCN